MNEKNPSPPPEQAGPTEASPAYLEVMLAEEMSDRQSYIHLYKRDDNIYSRYMDSVDPTIRPKIIELFEQELAMLQALDPQLTSAEEIGAIMRLCKKQRDELDPGTRTGG